MDLNLITRITKTRSNLYLLTSIVFTGLWLFLKSAESDLKARSRVPGPYPTDQDPLPTVFQLIWKSGGLHYDGEKCGNCRIINGIETSVLMDCIRLRDANNKSKRNVIKLSSIFQVSKALGGIQTYFPWKPSIKKTFSSLVISRPGGGIKMKIYIPALILGETCICSCLIWSRHAFGLCI